eukprot:1180110-Prorocentrum_minimum.AAC.2
MHRPRPRPMGECAAQSRPRRRPPQIISLVCYLLRVRVWRQLGDKVVYIAQGHCAFLEQQKDSYQVKPWVQFEGLRAAELCYVTELNYSIDERNNMHSIVTVRAR